MSTNNNISDLSKFNKFQGDKEDVIRYKDEFIELLRMKRVYWIFDDHQCPTRPTRAYNRIRDNRYTRDDLTDVANYEKAHKEHAQDSSIALGCFMHTLGELPKANLGDIHQMEKQEGTCRTLHHAWRKFNTRYAYDLTSVVTTIERKLNELPTAESPKQVIQLLDNICKYQHQLSKIDDHRGRRYEWTDTNLRQLLLTRVRGPGFDSLRAMAHQNYWSWEETERNYRREAEMIIAESGDEKKPKKSNESPLDFTQITSIFKDAIINNIKPSLTTTKLPYQQDTFNTINKDFKGKCWNCQNYGHMTSKCPLNICSKCVIKKRDANHHPSDCPYVVPTNRAKRTTDGVTKLQLVNSLLDINDTEPTYKRARIEDTVNNLCNILVNSSSVENNLDDNDLIYDDNYLIFSIDITKHADIASITSSNHNILIDSGAAVSVANSEIAQTWDAVVVKLSEPIRLVYGNNSQELVYEAAILGTLIGPVLISTKATLCIVSTTQLAQRRIFNKQTTDAVVLTDKLDKEILKINMYGKSVPMTTFRDVHKINCDNYEFDKPNIAMIDTLFRICSQTIDEVKKVRGFKKIQKKDYEDVIKLHERLMHMNPATMANAIKHGAWFGVKMNPYLIQEVFSHYECVACALAKRNKLTISSGRQIKIKTIGYCISIDRLPVRFKDINGNTGIYVIVDEAEGLIFGFLDKDYDIVKSIHAVRLFLQRYGCVVRRIRFDSGAVENSAKVLSYLSHKDVAIIPEPAGVDAQYQNLVERWIQQLVKCVATCIEAAKSNLSEKFWGVGCLSYCVVANYTPNTLSGMYSPWYRLTGNHPDLSETCSFPFGQKVSVAKTKQEMRRGYKFQTKNHVGYAIGSVIHRNKQTLVYLPEKCGSRKVFPRLNVIEIKEPKILWTDDEGNELEEEAVVIDEDENVNLNDVTSNIHGEYDEITPEYDTINDEQDNGNTESNHNETGDNSEAENKSNENSDAESTQSKINLKVKSKVKTFKRNSKRLLDIRAKRVRIPNKRYMENYVSSIQNYDIDDGLLAFVISQVKNGGTLTVTENFPTLKQALSSETRSMWIEAIEKELETLYRMSTYETIRYDMIPEGAQILPTKLVLRVKHNSLGEYLKHKARLVVLGNKDEADILDLFAPTACQKSVSLIIALTVQLGLAMQGLDICGAFLVPEIRRDVYVTLPKLWTDITSGKSIYWKLKRTLYGLSDSPKEFYDHVSNTLLSLGYIKTIADPCVFVKREGKEFTICVIHVDDFVVVATDNHRIEDLKRDLKRTYTLTEAPELESFIGMYLKHNQDGSITLSQPGYTNQMLEDFEVDHLDIARTPMSTEFNDEANDKTRDLNYEEKKKFNKILGSLIFLLRTRSDIAYAVIRLATRSQRVKLADLNAIIRVLRYLKGTKDLGITFHPTQKNRDKLVEIICYADAAYSVHTDGKSHSGYTYSLGDHKTGMFFSRSIKQSRVTTSSTEAELTSLEEAAKDIVWMRMLLEELGFEQNNATNIFEDNKSTIILASESRVNHKRTKHFIKSVYYLVDLYKQGLIKYTYVESENQIADILTKPLGIEQFEKLRDLLMGNVSYQIMSCFLNGTYDM